MATDAANAAGKQRGTPFKQGQSGNPAGKAKGTRHKTTLAIEALLDGQHAALTQKAIDLALAGDMQALRLCMDRLAPPRKDRPVQFDLPQITTAADAKLVMSSLLTAVATGELTPSEANEIGRVVDTFIETLKTTDLEERMARIEAERELP